MYNERLSESGQYFEFMIVSLISIISHNVYVVKMDSECNDLFHHTVNIRQDV